MSQTHFAKMLRMIVSGNKPVRRRKRSSLRKRVVELDIIIGVEARTGIGLVGTMEGETAEIGRIGT